MGKRTTWAGYVVFGVVVVFFSLYVCFPSEATRRYLEALVSRMEPGLVLKIEKIVPALPFGLKADRAGLRLKDEPGNVLFKADSFVIRPSLQTLTLKKPALNLDCRAYGGEIKGVITCSNVNFHGPYSSDLEISGLHLDQITAVKEKLEEDFFGIIDGTLTCRWAQGGFLQGVAQGEFSVVDGKVLFAQPFMDLQSIDFGRIDMELVLKDQKISLDRFDFNGKQMQGAASGTIHLDPVFNRSGLDLTVSVKPSPDFLIEKRALFDAVRFVTKPVQEGHFTINIRGTVAQPRINFNQ